MKKQKSILFSLIIICVLSSCNSIRQREIQASLGSVQLRMKNKEYDKAIRILDRILTAEPNNEKALLQRVFCYRFTKNYCEAEKDISKLIDLYPQNTEYLFYRGQILYEMERYSEAVSDLQNALHFADNIKLKLYCWNTLANAEFEQENYPAVIQTCIQYLKYREHEGIYILRGDAYFELKEYRRALDDYNTALATVQKNKRKIKDSLFYYYKGMSEIMCGRYKEALDDFEKLDEDFYKTKEYKEFCKQKLTEASSSTGSGASDK